MSDTVFFGIMLLLTIVVSICTSIFSWSYGYQNGLLKYKENLDRILIEKGSAQDQLKKETVKAEEFRKNLAKVSNDYQELMASFNKLKQRMEELSKENNNLKQKNTEIIET